MSVQVRVLRDAEVVVLMRELPTWSSRQYPLRLQAQRRGELVQVAAWEDEAPLGRGMVLFPAHEEYSISAERRGCAEVRDVFVAPDRRRGGVATALMGALESSAREAGMSRIGLAVSLDAPAAPARALYERLGYRYAHGPYVTSSTLVGDEGPFPVGAVLSFLVKDL